MPGKVLVVDDEADAREFVRAVLEDEGWEVVEAENGKTGLEKARNHSPDLVILDVQMPDLTGFQVFAELARSGDLGAVKVIMLTGVATKTGLGFSAEEMESFLGRAPDAYLEKPISPDTLVRTVQRVMG
ncbi:MAG: response regulator [Kiritimatiellaeota bacterium]|nr:response regulator [Kiritimatiellota bacterium]